METLEVSVMVTLAKISSLCCGRLLAVSHTVKVIESPLDHYRAKSEEIRCTGSCQVSLCLGCCWGMQMSRGHGHQAM